MTFKTLNVNFILKIMPELAENAPVYSFLPSIKNYQISKACVIPFGFRKGKTENLVVPSSKLYLVFG